MVFELRVFFVFFFFRVSSGHVSGTRIVGVGQEPFFQYTREELQNIVVETAIRGYLSFLWVFVQPLPCKDPHKIWGSLYN